VWGGRGSILTGEKGAVDGNGRGRPERHLLQMFLKRSDKSFWETRGSSFSSHERFDASTLEGSNTTWRGSSIWGWQWIVKEGQAQGTREKKRERRNLGRGETCGPLSAFTAQFTSSRQACKGVLLPDEFKTQKTGAHPNGRSQKDLRSRLLSGEATPGGRKGGQ